MSNRGDGEWLVLREPCDHRSRSAELAAAFADLLSEECLIIDLACGMGSNLRYLSRFVAPNRSWLCVDRDAEVLAQASVLAPDPRVRFGQLDKSHELQAVPSGQRAAITLAAFLDMTSPRWLDAFARHCHETPVLAAMSSSGRLTWDPADDADKGIGQLLLQHQRSDHGVGASLGPDAAHHLARRLEDQGHDVRLRQSDWELGASDATLLRKMIKGVARRVRSMPSTIDVVGWQNRRERQFKEARLRLTVGYLDLLSIPPRLQF